MAINSSRTGGTVGGITPTGQEVLTNKDIDGGSASNTNRITMPKNTTAVLNTLTRKAGTIVYDTSLNKMMLDNGTNLLDAGGGLNDFPSVNYLKLYSTADSAPGTLSTGLQLGNITVSGGTSAFYADNTSGSASLTTSASSLLRSPNTYLTALASPAAGIYFQFPVFTLQGTDLGKPITVSFDVTGVGADGDWDVVISHYNSTGTFIEEIPIAGAASSASTTPSAKLPVGTTNFKSFFISSSTATDVYALRFRRLAGSTQIRLDTLYIGPQSVVQGAAVTDWVAFTPTYATATLSLSSNTGFWKRDGDSLVMRVKQVANGGGSGSTIQYILPNSLVPDTAKMTANDFEMGNGHWYDASGTDNIPGYVTSDGTYVILNLQNGGNEDALDGADIASGDIITFTATIPIVGWSSNVTMANRAVEEFAYNSGTWDAADSTSFAYGSAGQAIGGALTANRLKRVRFQTPILSTDTLILEFQYNGQWVSAAALGLAFGLEQNGIGYGAALAPISSNATDCDVQFYRYSYANGATYGAVGQSWATYPTTSGRWRVRKVSGGASVGYPIGARNVVGDTTGTTVPTGYIGEVLNSTPSTTAHTTAILQVATISLTPGRWSVTAMSHMTANSTARYLLANLSTTAGSGTGTSAAGTRVLANYCTTASEGDVIIPNVIVDVATTTSYYLNVSCDSIAGLSVSSHWIRAVRIA